MAWKPEVFCRAYYKLINGKEIYFKSNKNNGVLGFWGDRKSVV